QSDEGTVAGNGETKKPRARQGFVDTKSRLDRRTVPKRLQARSYAVSGASQGIDSGPPYAFRSASMIVLSKQAESHAAPMFASRSVCRSKSYPLIASGPFTTSA